MMARRTPEEGRPGSRQRLAEQRADQLARRTDRLPEREPQGIVPRKWRLAKVTGTPELLAAVGNVVQFEFIDGTFTEEEGTQTLVQTARGSLKFALNLAGSPLPVDMVIAVWPDEKKHRWYTYVTNDFIRFEITGSGPGLFSAKLLNSSLADTGETVNVYDNMGIFATGTVGSKGYAVWMRDSGHYEILQLFRACP